MNGRILVVEDDAGLRMTLGDRLARERYEVTFARDGDEGLEAATSAPFDCILLDVRLPGRDGLAVCCALREAGVDAPILMLTACGETADKVAGLRLGADDYVTKPFQMMELVARIEACLRRRRRAEPGGGDAQIIGEARVDLGRMIVERGERRVPLTATESRILRYLLARRGAIVTRVELLGAVWGYDAGVTTRTVDVHVSSLRRAIEPNARTPRSLVTVHGVGYKLV